MNEDDTQAKLLTIVVLAGMIACVAVMVFGCAQTEQTNRVRYEADQATQQAAIKAGLVQGSIPGQSGVYWIKPEGK